MACPALRTSNWKNTGRTKKSNTEPGWKVEDGCYAASMKKPSKKPSLAGANHSWLSNNDKSIIGVNAFGVVACRRETVFVTFSNVVE